MVSDWNSLPKPAMYSSASQSVTVFAPSVSPVRLRLAAGVRPFDIAACGWEWVAAGKATVNGM